MKLSKIWSKIGKQPLHITQHTEAKVFVGDDQYYITSIKYESGKPLGFNAVKIDCGTCVNKTELPPLLLEKATIIGDYKSMNSIGKSIPAKIKVKFPGCDEWFEYKR